MGEAGDLIGDLAAEKVLWLVGEVLHVPSQVLPTEFGRIHVAPSSLAGFAHLDQLAGAAVLEKRSSLACKWRQSDQKVLK
jgi:hypothetical protein